MIKVQCLLIASAKLLHRWLRVAARIVGCLQDSGMKFRFVGAAYVAFVPISANSASSVWMDFGAIFVFLKFHGGISYGAFGHLDVHEFSLAYSSKIRICCV